MKIELLVAGFICLIVLTSGQEVKRPPGPVVPVGPPIISQCCLNGWYDCCGYLFGYRYGVLPPQYPRYPPIPLMDNYIS